MMYMALPYTIVLTVVGLLCTWEWMPVATEWFIENGFLQETTKEFILSK